MPKILKNNWFDLIIIFLILILNLFWLPSLSYWGIYGTDQSISKSRISQFKIPSSPVVKLASKPQTTAQNYILVDLETNKILISKNSEEKIYPASTTKLITALTALNIYPLDEVVSINEEYMEGQNMGLKIGEKITIKSLVSALLVYSANDAAFTLAKQHPQGFDGFVRQMNLLVKKYNLKNTNFVNVDGLQNENHYSTVYDLSQIGRIAVQNNIVKNTVKNKEITISSVDGSNQHYLVSTDELLATTPEIEGLKTGWTPEAKGCFVGLINLNGHYLISVVAQSDDRFQDTKNILDWAKQNVSW